MRSGKVVAVRAYDQSRLKGVSAQYVKGLRAKLIGNLNQQIEEKRNVLGSKNQLLAKVSKKISVSVNAKRKQLRGKR